jgi:hypothetical protein
MKRVKLAALCVVYGVMDLYLLLGWMASGQPQRVSLWNKLYGPLTFDLSPNADGYGLAFLLLSVLATIVFMVVLVRSARPATPATTAANPFTKES